MYNDSSGRFVLLKSAATLEEYCAAIRLEASAVPIQTSWPYTPLSHTARPCYRHFPNACFIKQHAARTCASFAKDTVSYSGQEWLNCWAAGVTSVMP